MTRSPVRDLLVGLFVLVGLGAVAYLSFSVGGVSYSGAGGLPLVASFDQTGGLKPRAPVMISGVKVGQVKSIALGEDYRAKVGLDVDKSLKLPVDTSASIVTAGILGDRYVSLQLGGEEDVLKPGDAITFTESAVILESLIGKFMYGKTGESTENGESGTSGENGSKPAPSDGGAKNGGAEKKGT